jgi:hypothetical protein
MTQSMTQNIRFCYWNCQGLTHSKLEIIHRLLQNEVDFLIIAEHWFAQSDALQKSPFFVINSKKSTKIRTQGHQNGGLALLAKPNVQDLLTHVHSNEFAISFSLHNENIMAVYLPPRLNEDEVKQILSDSPPNTSIMLGDINVRYGSLTGDNRKTNPARTLVFDAHCMSKNLTLQVANAGISRTDHLYATREIKWTYGIPDWVAHSDSDHDMMTGLIETLSCENYHTDNESTYKFAFSLLKEPIIEHIVIHHWDLLHGRDVQALIEDAEKEPVTIQSSLVDSVYTFFMGQISSLCEQLLPSYNTSHVRIQPRKAVTKNLSQELSHTQAIRLFKQSKRSEAIQNHIQARRTGGSPAEEAYAYYQNMYGQRLPEVDEEPTEPQLDSGNQTTPFDEQDVRQVIQRYPAYKSGGPDGFDARIFKVLAKSRTFCAILHKLFSLFYSCATTPLDWNHSTLFLLLKDKAEPFADKTRPVSLTNMLRRFYEKLLLKTWLDTPWARLHPSQAGFRRGFNTITQIMLSDHLSRSKEISVFLDLTAAFDKVPHQRLLEILRQRGCPNHTLRIIYRLMVFNCCSTLIVNNRRNPNKIRRMHGVFQGSILSPFLFNIFIDPLAELLNAGTSQRPSALLYADDIGLKAKTAQQMRYLLLLCERWARENGMRWGIKKCGVIGSDDVFFLNGERVPSVSRYKYLGAPHGRTGIMWGEFLEEKEARFTGLIKSLMSVRRTWLHKTRLIIFKTFIRSTIDYCLPLITLWIETLPKNLRLKHTERLNRIQKLSLEFLFDSDRPRALLESISGIGSIHTRILILQASLCLQLKNISDLNPLTHILRWASLMGEHDSLLYRALNSTMAKEYSEFCATHPHLNRRWATFAQHKLLEDNVSSPGNLQHYVRNRARVKLKADSCLYLSLEKASMAIKWRSNKLFLNKKCAGCGANFNRAHIARCLLLNPEWSSIYSDSAFKDDLHDISTEIADKASEPSFEFCYTILDFLLNEKRYQEFEALISLIDNMLQKE